MPRREDTSDSDDAPGRRAPTDSSDEDAPVRRDNGDRRARTSSYAVSVAAKSAARMSRSHRARTVHPAASPAEDLRRTHDAWTRDLLDRLPHDDSDDPSDGDTPPRARATRHRSPTRDARREPRHRSPARAAPEEASVSTGPLEQQIAGLTRAVQALVDQQAAQLREQRTLQADMVQMRQQNVAVGEVVGGAMAPSEGGVAGEIAQKDGILTWTEENVGVLISCLAYRHLRSIDDWGDSEEAVEQAHEIKQAAMEYGIDGRSLFHLTIEDIEKIGEMAGVVEGGGTCALGKLGHRVALLTSLCVFRDQHGNKPWETVLELLKPTRVRMERERGKAELTTELCKTFGIDSIQGDNDNSALKAALVHTEGTKEVPKRPEVVVPVFATLLVKKIKEDMDGNVSLDATFIQRPLLYDIEAFDRESGKEALPYFAMRVNEGESKDCFELRKVTRGLSEAPKTAVHTDKKGYFATAASTFVATLPLKLDVVYSEPPFKIMSVTVTIELTSFIGTNALNEKFELRPSFVSHASDLRNLCSVRDWKDDYKMDEMKRWELVSPMPTIEYEYDGGKGKKSLYVPKLRVTYYLWKEPIIPLIAANMPIIFAYVANTYNILKCFKEEADFSDYVANNVALGLAVTFAIPFLMEEGDFDAEWKWGNVQVIWIFLSFGLSLPAYYWSKRQAYIIIAFQWASFIIPWYNWIQWGRRINKIRSNWKEKRDLRMTFLGRPGSISYWEQMNQRKSDTGKTANNKGQRNVLNGDLRTFVVKTGDPKKPKIKLNPDILSQAAMDTTYAEAGPARKGRCEPWQFDEKNHYIYCGLHRQYFQDCMYAKAIDHDQHNEPYKRRLRHDDPPPED